jgi:hypothetical protein
MPLNLQNTKLHQKQVFTKTDLVIFGDFVFFWQENFREYPLLQFVKS